MVKMGQKEKGKKGDKSYFISFNIFKKR